MKRFSAAGVRCAGLACVLLASVCRAQALDDQAIDQGALSETDRPNVEQTTGFIVDRTIANFGAEFFRQFSAAWRDQPGTEGIDVTVVERPSARFGSQISIEHNNRPIARLFLYAGRSASIKPLAIEAARYVGTQLSSSALAAMVFGDPDLARDEIR